MVQQTLENTSYNNSSQILYKHIIYDAETNTITNKGDILFKKGDYTHTYIGVKTEGIPDDVILNLVDEESNLLYSPVDTNKNWITTQCSITVGETDIIQLPAQFNDDLSSFMPFDSGTYNWKLKFSGNDDFNEIEIPFVTDIIDFNFWECESIYPLQDLKVQLKTPANTYYPLNYANQILTQNASYDEATGIVTYPSQDLISMTPGKHMQIINQENNCFIDYEVKNPLYIPSWVTDTREYTSNNINLATAIYKECPLQYDVWSKWEVKANNKKINSSNRARYSDSSKQQGDNQIPGSLLPPGTYNMVFNVVLSDNNEYVCEKNITVTTENCELILNNNNGGIKTRYFHQDITPISNALIILKQNNDFYNEARTDENGEIVWGILPPGVYQCTAIDADGTSPLLLSNTIEVLYKLKFVSTNSIVQKDDTTEIKVQIVDADNNPVQGKNIKLYIDT